MSNVSTVNNNEFLRPNTVLEKEQKNITKQKQKEEKVQDVIDDKLKQTIKNENISAATVELTSAEQAASILTDVLNKITQTPSAKNTHKNIDAIRVNALVNQ